MTTCASGACGCGPATCGPATCDPKAPPQKGPPPIPCPRCGAPMRTVLAATLESVLNEGGLAAWGGKGPLFICRTPGCAVVYSNLVGNPVLTQEHLKHPYGAKLGADPAIACPCFGFTWDQVETRKKADPVSATIAAKIGSEGCDCRHTNPEGICCLAAVKEREEGG